MELKENNLAPNFKLPSSDGKEVSLKDFYGKNLVLYFYPKDSTPGCTIQGNDFSSKLEEFKKINTIIVGVSKDNAKSHKNFITKQCIKFDLLSDVDGTICNLYGVWKEKSMFGKKYMGIERSTFLIDKDGVLRKIWHKVNVNGHANNVLMEAKKLNSLLVT
ncbi:thioredoxin-dependent thiol peroxidase [Candidatus Bandiella euplotis]|uniref:thioredoxin-dependent thiol peroxidase n=1 Tax=Candidatus Bandiella euplotis TaxID=1664265 RepID=UPI002B263319|nr:thioredoxin-dependent thiol peroxidase [Candidatus Bandiella woodruffii]